MDVLAACAAHAASAPARLAHRWAGGDLTWGELWRQSGALAGRLTAALPPDRSPVVILAHKQSTALVCMLACVRAGRPYVPVDDSIALGRLTVTIAAAGAAAVLAVSPTPHVDAPDGCIVWHTAAIDEACASDAAPPDPTRATSGDETWYVIFTSGSTGEPKGVQISAANLASFLDWSVTHLPPRPDAADAATPHVFLNQAPWSFDLSVMDTWTSLATGSTLVSIDRDQLARPSSLVAALGASGATVWVSTPSFAALCLAFDAFTDALVAVETFWFCGETLPPATASALLDRFPGARVINTYGPTEATVAVTGVEIGPDDATHVLPVGRPKPGCIVTIRTPQGDVVAPGETGEIWIHGDTVSAGYLGRPDLTEHAFAPSRVPGVADDLPTYRTGDAGYLDGDLLYFVGRLDHQIKLHGYRIELGDIEAHVRRLPEVVGCVVIPRGDPAALTHLEAFATLVEATPRTLATTLALRRALTEYLPDYMIPKTFTYVDDFPMTTNGKVDRRALAAT